MNTLFRLRNKILGIAISTMIMTGSVKASETYDINMFDVYGVTIGMNAEEAIQYLIDRYSLNKDDIEFRYEHGTTVRDIPMRMAYSSDDLSIVIWFQPNLAAKNAGYTTVESIRIRDKSKARNEQVEGMIAKFGAPSVTIGENSETKSYKWCAELNKKKTGCVYEPGEFTYTIHGVELRGNEDELWAILREARSMMQELGVPDW